MDSSLNEKRKLSDAEEDDLECKFRKIGLDVYNSNVHSRKAESEAIQPIIPYPTLSITSPLKDGSQQRGSKRRSISSRKPPNPTSVALESIPETDDEQNSSILETSKPPKLRLKKLYVAISEFSFRSPLPSSSNDTNPWAASMSDLKLNPEHSQLILYSPMASPNDPNATPPILSYSSAPSPTENYARTSPNETTSEDIEMLN
jgi:hypothetical protein